MILKNLQWQKIYRTVFIFIISFCYSSSLFTTVQGSLREQTVNFLDYLKSSIQIEEEDIAEDDKDIESRLTPFILGTLLTSIIWGIGIIWYHTVIKTRINLAHKRDYNIHWRKIQLYDFVIIAFKILMKDFSLLMLLFVIMTMIIIVLGAKLLYAQQLKYRSELHEIQDKKMLFRSFLISFLFTLGCIFLLLLVNVQKCILVNPRNPNTNSFSAKFYTCILNDFSALINPDDVDML